MEDRIHVREHTHFVVFSRLNNDKEHSQASASRVRLESDDSSNKALYGKPFNNSEIVEGHPIRPATAQPPVQS